MVFQPVLQNFRGRRQDRNLDYVVHKIDMHRKTNQMVELGMLLHDPKSRKWKLDATLAKKLKLSFWYYIEDIREARFPYREARVLVVYFASTWQTKQQLLSGASAHLMVSLPGNIGNSGSNNLKRCAKNLRSIELARNKMWRDS